MYLHLDVVGLTAAAVADLFPEPIMLGPDSASEALAESLQRQLQGSPKGIPSPATHALAKAFAYLVVARLLHTIAPRKLERCFPLMGGGHLVSPALEHINRALGALHANAHLARLCHLSEDHFIRRFRDHVGQTPAQYVAERRVAAAAERLAFSDESIERIAEDLGFPNRSYFTRVFTRRIGLPPAAYRKQPLV